MKIKMKNTKFVELSTLVDRAIGNRTIECFIDECGFYDSKMIKDIVNLKTDTFPQIIELKRIAENSQGRVTYNELRVLCGYSEDDILDVKVFNPKRGEIYLVNFGVGIDSEVSGTRPFVVISNWKNNEHSTNLSGFPCTTKIGKRCLPTHVRIWNECGLKTLTDIQTELVTTISKRRFFINGSSPILFGKVTDEVMQKIEPAALKQLGFIDLYFNEELAYKKYIALKAATREVKRLEKFYNRHLNNLKLYKEIQELKLTTEIVKEEFQIYCLNYDKDYKHVYDYFRNKELIENKNINSSINLKLVSSY